MAPGCCLCSQLESETQTNEKAYNACFLPCVYMVLTTQDHGRMSSREEGEEVLILHLPLLKNNALPRIPSQCVLAAHQPGSQPIPMATVGMGKAQLT